MKVKVDEHTRLADVAYMADAMFCPALADAARAHFGVSDWYAITIDTFCDLTAGDWSAFGFVTVDMTLYEWALLRDFRDFAAGFCDVLGRLVVPATLAEKTASAGLPELTAFEFMAGFARRFFGLKSFLDGGEVTLGEYLLARKEDYRRQMAERRMLAEQRRKSNVKR